MRPLGRLAAVVLVVGLLSAGALAYNNRTVTVEHGTVSSLEGHLELGPHEPGLHEWAVWVEDYYPGQDTEGQFQFYASEDPPEGAFGDAPPMEYRTREFAGVQCEHMYSWEPWSVVDGDVYFVVEWDDHDVTPPDTAEVFLVRSGARVTWFLFAVAAVVSAVSLAVLVYAVRVGPPHHRDGIA